MRKRFLGISGLLLLSTVAAHADSASKHGQGGNTDMARLFLSGPVLLLLLVSFLAVAILIAAAFGRTEAFTLLGSRATERLEHGRTLSMLWGLAASILIFAVTVALYGTKVLALLGVLVMLAGLTLAGIGIGTGAMFFGKRLAEALGRIEPDDLTVLRLGLTALLMASFLPFLGWLVVLLIIAAGIGAVLEAMLTSRRD